MKGELNEMPPKRKVRVDYTEEQLLALSREDMIEDLNDREIAFCEFYIKDYNIKLAAIKAGFAPRSANTAGIKLRNKKAVNNYIAWLKLRVYQKACVDAIDIINFYAKAGFADISDYVDVINGRQVRLKDLDVIDGQLIQEISQGANGNISIKLIDKLTALKRLENYMDTNPYDWQRKIEEKKLEILEQRLEIEKLKINPVISEEDDGFIDALEKAANGIFDDEDEDEEEDMEQVEK